MAKQYWGANKGDNFVNVQEGTSDLGTDIEVIVDLTKISVLNDAIVALTAIRDRMVQNDAKVLS